MFVLLAVVYKNQEFYATLEGMLDDIKIEMGHCRKEPSKTATGKRLSSLFATWCPARRNLTGSGGCWIFSEISPAFDWLSLADHDVTSIEVQLGDAVMKVWLIWVIAVVGLLVIVGLWYWTPDYVVNAIGQGPTKSLKVEDMTRAGQYGDLFGAVNALFSGLAFLGVLIAILLQQKQLMLQQREIDDGEKALIESRKLQNDISKSLARQAESTKLAAYLSTLKAFQELQAINTNGSAAILGKVRQVLTVIESTLPETVYKALDPMAKKEAFLKCIDDMALKLKNRMMPESRGRNAVAARMDAPSVKTHISESLQPDMQGLQLGYDDLYSSEMQNISERLDRLVTMPMKFSERLMSSGIQGVLEGQAYGEFSRECEAVLAELKSIADKVREEIKHAQE